MWAARSQAEQRRKVMPFTSADMVSVIMDVCTVL